MEKSRNEHEEAQPASGAVNILTCYLLSDRPRARSLAYSIFNSHSNSMIGIILLLQRGIEAWRG